MYVAPGVFLRGSASAEIGVIVGDVPGQTRLRKHIAENVPPIEQTTLRKDT
jgi:hypothetical protein